MLLCKKIKVELTFEKLKITVNLSLQNISQYIIKHMNKKYKLFVFNRDQGDLW